MQRSTIDLQTFKAAFFRALAHPLRIRILEELRGGPRSVHELQEALGVDQPSVSQQLAVLRNKNLVVGTKVGTNVHYAVRDPQIHRLMLTARAICSSHLVDAQAMLKELQRETRRVP